MAGSGHFGGLPRILDALVAGTVLLVLSPLLLFLAAVVRLTSPGPAFFRQRRMGRDGNPFTLLKFRSMTAVNAGPSVTVAGDRRVTPVGRLLRRLKLDELPQFWNVLVGEMALVGPRPEVPELVDLSDPEWRMILSVRPGITDPVTVRLRNEEELLARAAEAGLTPSQFYQGHLQPWKKRGYIEYVEKRSAWTDLQVLFRTVLSVIAPPPLPTLEEITGLCPSSEGTRS